MARGQTPRVVDVSCMSAARGWRGSCGHEACLYIYPDAIHPRGTERVQNERAPGNGREREGVTFSRRPATASVIAPAGRVSRTEQRERAAEAAMNERIPQGWESE